MNSEPEIREQCPSFGGRRALSRILYSAFRVPRSAFHIPPSTTHHPPPTTLFSPLRALRVLRANLSPSNRPTVRPPDRLRRAFTLLELLAVMAIIAILMAVISGGLRSAVNHAKRARGEAQLRDLLKAWTQYYTVYGAWPATYDGAEKEMTFNNLKPLFADDTVNNGRAIPFLAIKIADGETYRDPWKNPYKVTFHAPEATNEAFMRISVALPNRDRYRY